jgi:hypothetical protein
MCNDIITLIIQSKEALPAEVKESSTDEDVEKCCIIGSKMEGGAMSWRMRKPQASGKPKETHSPIST